MLRLEAKSTPVAVISCYVPTEEADPATKDDFYQGLQATTVDDTPKGDLPTTAWQRHESKARPSA